MEIPLRYAYQLGTAMGRSTAAHYQSEGAHGSPLEGPQQIQYPGGKNGFWKVSCKCGREVGPAPSIGQAESRLREHIKAMEYNEGRNKK